MNIFTSTKGYIGNRLQMSLTKEFSEMVQDQSRKYRFIHPLISGLEFRAFLSVDKKSRWMSEYRLLQEKAREQHWQNVPPLLEPLHNPDTAIIITDAGQHIEWVNKGFFHMTGYTLDEVAGRNPNILQGSRTSVDDVHRIRHSIKTLEPFSSVILNYRKSGEAYYCKVDIFPLYNDSNILVNFLAIENETSLQTG